LNDEPSSQPSVSDRETGTSCLNCGTPRLGTYCYGCGQRFHDGQLTLGMVWRWFAHDVLDLDRGLLLAVREMTRRPGVMIRSYVAGQRQRYGNPFTYLFLNGALSLVLWTLLSDPVAAQMRARLARRALSIASFSPEQRSRWIELQLALVPYSAQIALAMCLAFVVLLRLLFRKSGYNFAEIFVFGLFATGQIFLVGSVVFIALLLLGSSYSVHTALTLALYPVIYTQAALGFFGRRVGTVAKVLLALVLSFVGYSLLQSWLVRVYVRLVT
jgi:Protein of unknown function (DUF3667)